MGAPYQKYAQALFDRAQAKGNIPQVEEKFKHFLRNLRESGVFSEVFFNVQLDKERKKKLLRDFLEGPDVLLDFLNLVIERGRESLIYDIERTMVHILDQHRGIMRGEIHSAFPLSKNEYQDIVNVVSKKFDSKVELTKVTDPGILGGVVVRVGDKVFDGSLKGALKDLAVSLKR